MRQKLIQSTLVKSVKINILLNLWTLLSKQENMHLIYLSLASKKTLPTASMLNFSRRTKAVGGYHIKHKRRWTNVAICTYLDMFNNRTLHIGDSYFKIFRREVNMGLLIPIFGEIQIVPQLIGILILIVNLVSPHFKARQSILIATFVTNLLFVVMYIYLSVWSSVLVVSICVLRDIIFICYAKRDKSTPIWLLFLIISFLISSVVLVYNDLRDLLLLSTVVYTYAAWQKRIWVLRLGILVANISFIFFDLLHRALTSAFATILELISVILAIIRYGIKN